MAGLSWVRVSRGVLAALLIAPVAALAQGGKAAPKTAEGPKTKPIVAAVDVRVPIAPTAFRADGKWHVVYELHLNNMDRRPYRLTKVEVVSADSTSHSLVAYTGAGLDSAVGRPGQPAVVEKRHWVPARWPSSTLGDGGFGRCGATGDPAAVDLQDRHLSRGDHSANRVHSGRARGRDDRSAVARRSLATANGPSNTSGHRRALIPIDGHATISQRMAIDWVRLRDHGKTFHGDEKDNKSYYAYGSDALAVADGVVTEVKDGIPQNIPGENSRAVPITLETVGGNHVILDIGGGHYAFYAHLQPGIFAREAGGQGPARAGTGLVGNSGNCRRSRTAFSTSRMAIRR